MDASNDAHIGETPLPSVRYDDWRAPIQIASDLDQLVRIVREYLATWAPDQLANLPIEVGATALASAADIPARAVLAAQADLRCNGEEPTANLLREMALTLCAAASRLGFLVTMPRKDAMSISGDTEPV